MKKIFWNWLTKIISQDKKKKQRMSFGIFLILMVMYIQLIARFTEMPALIRTLVSFLAYVYIIRTHFK